MHVKRGRKRPWAALAALFGVGALVAGAIVVPAAQRAAMAESDGTLTVKKVDDNGNALSGAIMQLLDSNGTVVHEWESGSEPEPITGLDYPADYTIHEAVAPAGYQLAADRTVRLAAPAAPANPLSGTLSPTNDFTHGMAVNGTVVYCLNRFTLHDGPSISQELGKLSEVSFASDPAQQAGPQKPEYARFNSTFQVEANRDKILGAVLVGYPNDLAGLQAEYGMSDAEFHQLTQDLVWYYANGLQPGAFDTSRADYNFHQSAKYSAWWNAIKAAAESFDTTGYDAIVYGEPGKQPMVGTNVFASSNEAPNIEVTVEDKPLEGNVSVRILKDWEGAESTDDLEATFVVKNRDGDEVREVTLNSTTGWDTQIDNLPAADAPYTVEETNATAGWESSVVRSSTMVESQHTETVTGWEEVEPNVPGGPYVLNFKTIDEDLPDDENPVYGALFDDNGPKVSANGAAPGELPANYQWRLVDANRGDGQFYLQNVGTGETLINVDANGSRLRTDTANQDYGTRMSLESAGDGEYFLVGNLSWLGVPTSYVLKMDDPNGSPAFINVNSNAASEWAGISTTLTFLEQVTREVTITTATAIDTFHFTNTQPSDEEEYSAQFDLKKTVKGGNIADYDGDFEFKIVSGTGVAPDGETVIENVPGIGLTATNDATGKISFPEITFTQRGTYTYKVKETIPADANKKAGIEYDNSEKTVTIRVGVPAEDAGTTQGGE